ncbi:MAG: Adenosine monophosphate-protein transferase [Chthonomonadaceae bacterium]|nr:Adenosine monophosphate-protein transferase [Chthonomonadaceae bacterium]
MPTPNSNPIFSSALPIGHLALHAMIGSHLPLPAVRSYIIAGARRTHQESTFTEEYYTPQYAPEPTILGNLRFALRYEPIDLGILYEALIALGRDALTDWIRAEPTGAYSRRAWFFYEMLTGDILDLPAVQTGNYVDALNAKLHFVASPVNSPRQRVRNNLLGTSDLCPTVRRTRRLEAMIAMGLDQEARRLTAEYAPETLARAVSFLYTKETRSSFAIEGEAPSPVREERFLRALRSLASFDPTDKVALIELQGSIVEPRYAAQNYRDFQNFVGETTRRYGEYVHFIGPRPQDVPALMTGWMALTERMLHAPLDPVIAAAASAFAFVFIHPFEDGNGRMHRFLMHYALHRRNFTPPDLIFPISAAILRRRSLYDATLEAFSKPVLDATDWEFTDDQGVFVKNDTRNLYRFFDATQQAEYLYDRIAETIREDFKEELEFLSMFDAAFTAVRNVVEMPDRRAALLVRLCLQNGGRLSQNKRKQFPELTDEEIVAMEAALAPLLSTHLKS